MDLSGHVTRLHSELLLATGAADPAVAAAAERLASALEAGFRLTLLEALAEAAEEITRELAPGSVEVRLRGREPEFVVNPPPEYPEAAAPAVPFAAGRPADLDEATARLTLRLPEQLKAQVESAAACEGLSVNAWLVRTVAAAVHPSEPIVPVAWPTARQQLRGWVR